MFAQIFSESQQAGLRDFPLMHPLMPSGIDAIECDNPDPEQIWCQPSQTLLPYEAMETKRRSIACFADEIHSRGYHGLEGDKSWRVNSPASSSEAACSDVLEQLEPPVSISLSQVDLQSSEPYYYLVKSRSALHCINYRA